MPTTDNLLDELLNSLEAIVLAQPDIRQRSEKLRQIGAAAGSPEGHCYNRAQEWTIQRIKAPREQLKLSQWLNRELASMTTPQQKAYRKKLREVQKARA